MQSACWELEQNRNTILSAHLFTDMQVGNAVPFSTFFPLKTLAVALQ